MVTNLQIMSESPEYKAGSELEEELTAEEKKAIAQTLKKIRKKKLEKRNEDDEDNASDVEEIVSPSVLWERLREFTETQGGRRSTSSSSSSGTVVASLERKFEVLKCSKEKGNPLPGLRIKFTLSQTFFRQIAQSGAREILTQRQICCHL